jgi:hypothetical protein
MHITAPAEINGTQSFGNDTTSVAGRRNFLSAAAVIAFLAGAGMSKKIIIVGETFLGEYILVFGGALLLLFGGFGQDISKKTLRMFLALCAAMLLSYVLTDFYRETEQAQYLRGWARIAVLAANTFFLGLLAGRDKRSILFFFAGYALAEALRLAVEGVPITVWKIAWGPPIAFGVLLFTPFLPRPLRFILPMLIGTLAIFTDYRSLAGILLLVGFCLFIMGKTRSLRDILIITLRVAVGGAITAGLLFVFLQRTSDDFEQRRMKSNIGRKNAIIVSFKAIQDSPFIGHGSWTKNYEYARLLRERLKKEFAEAGIVSPQMQRVMGETFRPHSYILQSWVEGGLLAAFFFMVNFYKIFQAGRFTVFRRKNDIFTPILCFVFIQQAWDILFSPFGALERVFIASCIVLICIVDRDRELLASAEGQGTEAQGA